MPFAAKNEAVQSKDEKMMDVDQNAGDQEDDNNDTVDEDDNSQNELDGNSTTADEFNKPMTITSDEVNFLVYRYLQESGKDIHRL